MSTKNLSYVIYSNAYRRTYKKERETMSMDNVLLSQRNSFVLFVWITLSKQEIVRICNIVQIICSIVLNISINKQSAKKFKSISKSMPMLMQVNLNIHVSCWVGVGKQITNLFILMGLSWTHAWKRYDMCMLVCWYVYVSRTN